MIKFYYNTGPNPMKIALFLEEANLDYEAIPIDTRKGEQHKDDDLKIDPNAKAPTIVDGDNIIFDRNAILLYLGEKTNEFMPNNDLKSKSELYSWLMFVATGIGPYSGQSVHFQHMAPEKIKYAINRYTYEAERHYNILNNRLEKNEYMLGNTYTIVDMAVWGWTRMIEKVIAVGELDKRKNLKRLMNYINARPASEKAENIAKINKHNFKIEIDEDASKHMFPQNERLK